MTDRDPWDRREGETSDAFEAFVAYRDMGPSRSLAKLGQKQGKNRSHFEGWSSKWEWVARSKSWDDHLDKLIQRTTEDAVVDAQKIALEQNIKIIGMIKGIAVSQLNVWAQLIDEWQQDGSKPEKYPLNINIKDISTLLDKTFNQERLHYGEPTSNVNVTTGARRLIVISPPKKESETQ